VYEQKVSENRKKVDERSLEKIFGGGRQELEHQSENKTGKANER